jgi:hypothetical protein
VLQVRRLPGPLAEGLPQARYPVSKTGGRRRLGGSTPSPSALEAWPSWKGSALLMRRRATVRRFESCCLRLRCDVVQSAGRPAVNRRMLVRAQPSQLSRPGLLAGQDAGPSNRRRGFESRSGLLLALGRVWRRGLAVSRVRRVRSPSRALLAVAQRMSTRLLPWPTEVRLLPARLRRKASSEPAGREPVEQGAIPWRRLTLFAGAIRRADPAARIPACGAADP